MGDRYILTVSCPNCGAVDEDVYYAPTCDFTTHTCSKCGTVIDLVEYTGITYEEASNLVMIVGRLTRWLRESREVLRFEDQDARIGKAV